MITKKQNISLAIILSEGMFLGGAYSHIFKNAHSDAWLSIIIGTIIGIIITYIINIILKHKGDKDLNVYLKTSGFIGKIIKLLLILLAMFFIYQMIMILQTFATSFFLLNTPPLMINIPIILIALYTLKNPTTLFKVAECLIVVIILGFVINILLLIPFSNITNIMPIFTVKSSNLLCGAFKYAIFSTSPLFLMLNTNCDGNSLIHSYIFSSLVLLAIALVISTVLGNELINIYRFPEYIVLKRVHLFNFIENIENIASIVWIFNEYILLTTSLKTINDLINKKMALYIIAFIITIITSISFGNNYIWELAIYYKTPIILGAFVILILLLFGIKKIKHMLD